MRNSHFQWIALAAMAVFGALARPAVAALTETATLPLNAGEDGLHVALSDDKTGFAYFVSSGSAGTIVKVKLSDMSRVGSISLSTAVVAGALDSINEKAYFISNAASTGYEVTRVDLGSFSVDLAQTVLDASLTPVSTIVIDSAGLFGYVSVSTSPATLIKIKLSDLSTVGTIPLRSNFPSFVVRDTTTPDSFAYYVSSTTPATVEKVDISTFTEDAFLTLGEGPAHSAAIDTRNKFLYLGLGTSPGQVAKVNLKTLSEAGAPLALRNGQNDVTTAFADPDNGFAYFGTDTSPGQVVRVSISSFQIFDSLTLASGENFLTSGIIDTGNQYLYAGTDTSPGKVVRVDLIGGLPFIEKNPQSVTVKPGGSASFGVTATGRSLTYQWNRNGAAIAGATTSVYTLTNVSLSDNGARFGCAVSNSSGTVSSSDAVLSIQPTVRVYPNPWRIDRNGGAPEITFDQLAPNSTIKIFTVSMHWVKTLKPQSGSIQWDLTNDAGQRVASGYYFYAITTGDDEQTSTGKIAIIK